MPTSAVKVVSGPCEPPNIWPKLQISFVVKMLFAAITLLSFATFGNLNAQTLNARISVVSTSPARIKIDLRFPSGINSLSFRNSYGAVLGLGERIEAVEAIRDNGEKARIEKLAPGEFQSAEKLVRFAYEINLASPVRPADFSHVSSLSSDHGVLMAADLLPQSTKATSFKSVVFDVEVPQGWTVASNVGNDGRQFSTDDPDTAVFLIGSALHERHQQLATTKFSIVKSGKWSFSDNDATKIAGKILEEYARVTRFQLKRDVVLMLIPYPGEVGPETWSAETRGDVVVLLLGRQAKGKRILSRLGIVLSHELFHLWVPNSLKLEGDYDWFFEGFTLYQALRLDLRLGLISFDGYLETLAGVYDSYRSAPDRDRLSLTELSQRRWTTSSSPVYVKGMLVAFIYDLLLRKSTDCRASLDDVYAELFRLPATGQRNANETIITLLSEHEGLKTFAQDYIENAAEINLDAMLADYGIQARTSRAGATQLVPVRDLNKTQRTLLGCIGYRN